MACALLFLAACSGGAADGETDRERAAASEEQAAETPPYLDDLAAPSMGAQIATAFCADIDDFSFDVLPTGMTSARCLSNATGYVVNFAIFDEPEGLSGYMAQTSCTEGLFYSQGPSWIAWSPMVEEQEAFLEAGVIPLSCT